MARSLTRIEGVVGKGLHVSAFAGPEMVPCIQLTPTNGGFAGLDREGVELLVNALQWWLKEEDQASCGR